MDYADQFSEEPCDDLVAQLAAHLGTTPEEAQEILGELMVGYRQWAKERLHALRRDLSEKDAEHEDGLPLDWDPIPVR